MAVSITAGAQRFSRSFELLGTATAYSETVSATGALDVMVPVSIVKVNGTATTVNENFTLGTCSVEGWEKYIVTGQGAATASDSIGTISIELSNPVGSTASTNNVVTMEYPAVAMLKWLNDRWACFAALNQTTAVTLTTATV